MSAVTIKSIAADQTHVLRQRVLRPHQTIAEMVYDGDEHLDAIHLGAFARELTHVEPKLIAVVSLYPEPMPVQDEPGDYRLRGMAVDPEFRGQGIGAKLLDAAIRAATQGGAERVWCNARVSAAVFYERAGFAGLGDHFELPGVGPHVRMARRCK